MKSVFNPQYKPFPEIKGNFGFGCMRLPLLDSGEVDLNEFSLMVDAFIGAGFNYFDTAHGYLEGKSELAIRECLSIRHKREDFILVNKLSSWCFDKNEDIKPFIESQLDLCGVEYFDFYLMHAQQKSVYSKYRDCRAYEEAFKLKAEGKIRHVGISFHDSAEFLEEILTDYPEIEVVQIQFNYADYGNPSVQSKKVLEVCRKFGKPVIVMEPIKGGNLAKLPKAAEGAVEELGITPANLALRFAAGFEGVIMTLSGMGSMDMLNENVSFMKDFKPLSERELLTVDKVMAILEGKDLIPCTACRYCEEGCPAKIKIPDLISCANNKKMYPKDWNAAFYYGVHSSAGAKASACIGCASCEDICPQHLPIRNILKNIAEEFEKREDN